MERVYVPAAVPVPRVKSAVTLILDTAAFPKALINSAHVDTLVPARGSTAKALIFIVSKAGSSNIFSAVLGSIESVISVESTGASSFCSGSTIETS